MTGETLGTNDPLGGVVRTNRESAFAGSIPELYDRGLGPVIFEPYAEDLVRRLPMTNRMRVLEIASGTGRVTQHLVDLLPFDAELMATDLSLEMLATARRCVQDSRLEWQVADAMDLPFDTNLYDAVLCQFGVMFFPDKLRAHSEVLRVLRPGGTYLFNAWGSHRQNPWADVCQRVMSQMFPDDPPRFLETPFGYCEPEEIVRCAIEAGFVGVAGHWEERDFVAASAGAFARGLVCGTPLSSAIADRDGDVEVCVHAVATEFRRQFGDHPMLSTMCAFVVTGRKPNLAA